ncbi:hypothetical protein GCM10027589_22080 [Actinocorallia lasiicapitis]
MDGRAERRAATVGRIIAAGIAVLAEEGELGLGAVARRIGMRTPSLYEYFPSKAALLDALFADSARSLRDALTGADGLRTAVTGLVEWTSRHPERARLMFWRPPGLYPSPEAADPAVAALNLLRDALLAEVAAGRLAPDAAEDDGSSVLSVLVAGLVSQQIAAAPAPLDVTGGVLDLFFARYTAKPAP